MKKLLILGIALLAGYSNIVNASSVSVLSSDGAFAGNTAAALTTLDLLTANAEIAANLSDSDSRTYLFGSTLSGAVSSASLNLSFTETVVNGAGNDFAFYFMGGSTEVNQMNACFTSNCVATDTFTASIIDGLGVSLGEFDSLENEIFYAISVVNIDLSNYGFAADAALSDFTIDLIAGGANRLAGIESFNTAGVSPVPVPAAVWLFLSGGLAMLGVARRKA